MAKITLVGVSYGPDDLQPREQPGDDAAVLEGKLEQAEEKIAELEAKQAVPAGGEREDAAQPEPAAPASHAPVSPPRRTPPRSADAG